MMIKVLSENTAASDEFGCEHGLSLYVETNRHRLLFDTGASGLFAENAGKQRLQQLHLPQSRLGHQPFFLFFKLNFQKGISPHLLNGKDFPLAKSFVHHFVSH